MIVTDLSQSFHPVPKESGRKDKRKADSSRIKQKSSKLAKLERNRFSIITKDLEHCYICTKKGMKNISKDDLHELLEGKNRQVRKMCEAIGHSVLALHRSKIAGIGVKDIPLRKMEIFK